MGLSRVTLRAMVTVLSIAAMGCIGGKEIGDPPASTGTRFRKQILQLSKPPHPQWGP